MTTRLVSMLILIELFLASPALASTWGAKFSGGARVDELKWSIAGNTAGTNPDILSELEWDRLEIVQVKGELDYVSDGYIYFKGFADYGLIRDGENRDSDYLGDGRTLEFSRSENGSGGSVWDGSGALGYTYFIGSGDVELVPLVGYSFHSQKLEIKDGMQTVSRFELAPPLGPITGLESSYETTWHGPWVGFDLRILFTKLSIDTGFEFHFTDYYAQADWNLRADLEHPKSFEHEAKGTGMVVKAGVDYSVTEHTAIGLEANYQDWETASGIDRTFLANGLILETKLNEVAWRSYAVMLELSRSF